MADEPTETTTEEPTEGGGAKAAALPTAEAGGGARDGDHGVLVQALERADESLEEKVEHELEKHLPPGVTTPAPGLLPGEVRPHPNPAQYVLIAVVLCAITAFEVGLYYLEGDIPDWFLIALLLGSALLKFVLVAAWYMHLRTDQPIFRRFFVIGIVAAVLLYLIVLLTLHAFE